MRLRYPPAILAVLLLCTALGGSALGEKPIMVGKATYRRLLKEGTSQAPSAGREVGKSVYRHMLKSARRTVFWENRPRLKIVYVTKEPASSAIRIESAIVGGKSSKREVAAEGAFRVTSDGKLRQVHGWAGRPLFGE
jgi:hypothetical protein